MPPYPSIQCKWSWIWPVYIDRCILGDPFSGYSILPGPVSNLGELKRILAWRYYNTILFEKWNTDHIIWCSSCLRKYKLTVSCSVIYSRMGINIDTITKKGLNRIVWSGSVNRTTPPQDFQIPCFRPESLDFYLTWSLTKYAGLGLKLGRPWWLKERD